MTSPLLDLKAAFRHARQQFVPREAKWRNPGDMARALDPKTISTPALRLIDEALEDVASGKTLRLMISMSPQEGKSEKVSRRFPTWMLHRNPSLRIAIVSYAYRIARRWGERIRDDIAEHGAKLDLDIKPDAAADEWRLTGKLGGVYCTGIGGPLTGRAVDCMRGDTLILTEAGYVPIRAIHESSARPRVLSVDHATGAKQWQPIVATRAVPDRPLVEVVTAAGRRLVCTPDHRIWVAGHGYVPAGSLRPGMGLVTSGESALLLRRRGLWQDLHQAPVDTVESGAGKAALLLPSVSRKPSSGANNLLGMRKAVCGSSLRGEEGATERLRSELLHQGMQQRHDRQGDSRSQSVRDLRQNQAHGEAQSALVLPGVQAGDSDRDSSLRAVRAGLHDSAVPAQQGRQGRAPAVLLARLFQRLAARFRAAVSTLRKTDRVQGPGTPVLLKGMPTGGQSCRQGTPLPAVRAGIRAQKFATRVLRPHVRGRCARPTDDRFRQLALQDGNELRKLVPFDATADLRTGRPCLRGVQGTGPAVPGQVARQDDHAYKPGRASSERKTAGQPTTEFDHPVQDVPRGASQVGSDAVAMVRVLHGQRDTVYDLQVAGNHNFFAEAVLVHNCLIIDDPYKDGKQADSEAWNERVRGWWEEVAIPRLGPGVAVVIVATRWREDDLIGWLQDREDGDVWRVINIPAQADHDPNEGETDLLGREPGEYMVSARGRTREEWEARKKAMGTRAWTALCQGRPAPASGDIFQNDWWQEYGNPQWTVRSDGAHLAISFDEVIISMDCAFKDTDASDYVVLQVWGRRGIEAYLLDQVHERLSFVDTVDRFRRLCAKWPQAILKLIEDKANGTAVINMLSRTIGGIVPVEPHGSKIERAFAVSPFVEGKNVYLPSPEMAPWIDGFKLEMKLFPRGAHDDQCDAMTQALNRILLDPLLLEDDIIEDDEDGPAEGSISQW